MSFNIHLFIVYFRIILTDLWNLSQSNGHGDWRRQEARDLSDLVQARIKHLQVSGLILCTA